MQDTKPGFTVTVNDASETKIIGTDEVSKTSEVSPKPKTIKLVKGDENVDSP